MLVKRYTIVISIIRGTTYIGLSMNVRQFLKQSTYINTPYEAVLSPFYRCGNWNTEVLSNLSMVSKLISGRAGI